MVGPKFFIYVPVMFCHCSFVAIIHFQQWPHPTRPGLMGMVWWGKTHEVHLQLAEFMARFWPLTIKVIIWVPLLSS